MSPKTQVASLLQELARHIEVLQRGQESLQVTVDKLRQPNHSAAAVLTEPLAAAEREVEPAIWAAVLEGMESSAESLVCRQTVVQGEFEAKRLSHVFQLCRPQHLFDGDDTLDLPEAWVQRNCKWSATNALFEQV